MTFSLDSFFKTFLRPPTGTSPQDITAKILHFIDVVNNPAKYSDDNSTHALRAKRRSAKQSLRRLALKHQELAAKLMQEHAEKVSQ
jgi:hypothetical protein